LSKKSTPLSILMQEKITQTSDVTIEDERSEIERFSTLKQTNNYSVQYYSITRSSKLKSLFIVNKFSDLH